MIKKIAGHLSGVMANRGIFPEEDTAVYAYGFELVISSAAGILLAIVISLIYSQPLAWFFFLLAFIPLRRTAGGFHADSHIACNITFGISFSVFMLIPAFLSQLITPAILFSASLVSVIITAALSPVEANNKPLTDKKRVQNRRKSLILAAVFLLAAAGSFFVETKYFMPFLFLAMGQLAASLSLIAAKLFNKD
jgi:accessory gene regulator B